MAPIRSKLMEISYSDPKFQIRLTGYADTVIIDSGTQQTISAIRFGGYPEVIRAISDAIYGGASVELKQDDTTLYLNCRPKGYRRILSHDGIYAVATLMANDDSQTEENPADNRDEDAPENPRKCYVFCPPGDRASLFAEVDRKTAAPLIPEFQDYVLDSLIARGDLRQMKVLSFTERMEAWSLTLLPEDQNVTDILEQGLKDGRITIPGAAMDAADGFAEVNSVTSYLNTFGVTVADRIRSQFVPKFDPASEPLSEEVLGVNDYIHEKAGYSLYDAQLAVTEAVKRQLCQQKMALIVAECGSGKTKLSAAATGALNALEGRGTGKSFNLVMCPSHVTGKWVREIAETLPDTYGMVVKSITDVDRIFDLYQRGDKNVYAVFSKERARDGYMRYPAVLWSRRKRGFVCPDCLELIEMETSGDGTRYMVPSDQFFFQKEHLANHLCPHCGTPLWAPVNDRRQMPWIKIGGYGWVFRPQAAMHLNRTKNEHILEQLRQFAEHPERPYCIKGAHRRFPLSTYLKKKYRGRISSFLCDELHEYNNDSGQGDAMAELYGISRKFIGMTATLINGYSSGIFHLLYRIVPGLMQKDGKSHDAPSRFDAEYGVVENTYEITDADYNSNRRSAKSKKRSRQLPGVSPLVFSRFLLECTAFLSLSDMGKDLPDYEEMPIPLTMPKPIEEAYKKAERELTSVLRNDRKAANKILPAYLNLLTVYPDQPYDQPEIIHPISGCTIVKPEDMADFQTVLPKEEKVLEIVRAKIAAGERVMIYTSWTRTDIEELGNDGKNLLQRYLPALTKENILAQMAGPAVEALRDEPLLSPEVESRKLRETIRELENNVLYLTGQQDMTTAQQQNSKTALRELREKEDALRNEEQSLKSKQFAGVDIAALNDELADLSARYSDLANQRQIPTASDGCILALTQELTARKAAVYTPKYAEATAQVNARIRQLGSQYQQEKEQCSQLKPGYQCPTCRRAVTADELPAMQNAFRTSIKQIVEAGQAERAKLEELQALEKKARDTFLQFQKDDIAKLEETLQEAKEAAEPDATRPEAQQLQERMQALAAELEFGALSQEEYDRMFACREELQQVRADIAAIEKATPAAGDLDSRLKAARAEIEQCKLKLQYLAQYIGKRAEMTFSALKMNRVEISLYDVVKSTGEVKDAFKFTYNGRRYDWLSLSEKIRAGMEVSELMKRLTGRNYPQFVDNMESVDDLANVCPTGQVIMAKCVSKAELSVRPVKPILTAMPTAA